MKRLLRYEPIQRLMIAILDTNILISALLGPPSLPAKIVDFWADRRFQLVTSEDQITELRRVSKYPKISQQLSAPVAGRLVNEMRKSASFARSLPKIDLCRDPMDNFLLAMAQVSGADYLVSGDKLDLLVLGRFQATRIVSVRQFADLLGI